MKPRIALTRCQTYRQGEVNAAVRKSVELLGGIGKFVREGEKILVKPNLLRPSRPEDAIITHPAVVKAVVELIQDAGCSVIIGDSPGGPLNARYLKLFYRKAGYDKLAEETGAQLNYNTGETITSNPEGRLIKAFDLIQVYSEVDGVVSLPKLKTHVLTGLTCATKNLFGLVPGLKKSAYHGKLRDVENFSEMLLDLVGLVKPRLSIVDAVVGMGGEGPSHGDKVKVGLIMAGGDVVALDVVAAYLTGMDVRDVKTLKTAVDRGLTTGLIEDVDVVGVNPGEVRVAGFRHPAYAERQGLVGRILSVISKKLILNPTATDKCVSCGVCVENCPVQAISIEDGRARMDLSKCIRCYCCYELCPHNAVMLKKPILGRFLH